MIFFGSRVGNSLILRLNEKAIIDPTSIDTIETMNGDEIETPEPVPPEPVEAVNGESTKQTENPNIDTDVITPNQKTDVVYFASEQGTGESKKQAVTYSLEYCDQLINIGPCGYAIVGEGDSEETRLLQRHLPPHYQTTPFDLITTSGTGKCGSISILQQTIKPELITTQALPGSIDMWTVASFNQDPQRAHEHAFILISQETSTLIFQTGTDITELEHGGFLTNEQTIFCGNIGEQYIVQVTRLHVLLLRDSVQLQNLSFESNPLRFATSLDRYLAILTTHGVIRIYSLQKDDHDQLKLIEYRRLDDKKYIGLSLYIDHSGLFTTTMNHPGHPNSSTAQSPKQETSHGNSTSMASNPLNAAEFAAGDDEEEWLYGGKAVENPVSSTTFEPMDSTTVPLVTDSASAGNNQSTNAAAPITRWLLTISRDSTLTLHELTRDDNAPTIARFEIARFNNALKVLVDVHDTTPTMTNHIGKIDTPTSAYVYEILMIGFGPKKDRVHLIVSCWRDRTDPTSLLLNVSLLGTY